MAGGIQKRGAVNRNKGVAISYVIAKKGDTNIKVFVSPFFRARQNAPKRSGGVFCKKPPAMPVEEKRALASSDVSLQKSSFVLNCMQAGNRTQGKNKGERYYEKSK